MLKPGKINKINLKNLSNFKDAKSGSLKSNHRLQPVHTYHMATFDSTTSAAAMPFEQESQDKEVTAMSATPTSSNNVNNSGNSPRNTVTPSTMSGTFVQLGSVEVPKTLQDGEKFVKWDEVSPFHKFLLKNET